MKYTTRSPEELKALETGRHSADCSPASGSAWSVIYSVMSLVAAIAGIWAFIAGKTDDGRWLVLLCYVLSIKADLKKQSTPNVQALPRAVLGIIEQPKPSIEELERILSSGEQPAIEIQPDGSIRAVPQGTAKSATVKPITLKQALGIRQPEGAVAVGCTDGFSAVELRNRLRIV